MSDAKASTATKSRIDDAFAKVRAEGRIALMPFVTSGYPNLAQTRVLVTAIVAGGADLIEIGVPFSDPLADGATVQRTSQIALDNGVTLRDLILMVAPTSTDKRVEDIADKASGFIYFVSLTGVTGAQSDVSEELPAYL